MNISSESLPKIFLLFFFFFLHIVIVLRKIEIKKIYIFSSFLLRILLSELLLAYAGLWRSWDRQKRHGYKNTYNKNEIFDNITNLVTNNLVESSSYRSTSIFLIFFSIFLKIFFDIFFFFSMKNKIHCPTALFFR